MKIAAFLVAGFILLHVGNLLLDAGILVSIESSSDYSCKKVEGVTGPEDMARLGSTLFISSTRLPYRYNFEKGDIYALDLSSPSAIPQSLAERFNLSPHGIFAAEFEDTKRLWVVNHGDKYDSVEIFDYRDGRLFFKKSIKLNKPNANDVVAINLDKFFVTHDHGSKSEFGKTLENYSRLGQGSLTYVARDSQQTIESGLSFANGIEYKDRKLYVAQMLGKKISVYRLDNEELEKVKDIDLSYLPDNMTLTGKGHLIVAAHPRAFDLKAHAKSGKEKAPSVIVNINPETGAEKIIFQDDGSLISAASAAVAGREELFVGNIFSDYFLRCIKR